MAYLFIAKNLQMKNRFFMSNKIVLFDDAAQMNFSSYEFK